MEMRGSALREEGGKFCPENCKSHGIAVRRQSREGARTTQAKGGQTLGTAVGSHPMCFGSDPVEGKAKGREMVGQHFSSQASQRRMTWRQTSLP